MATSEGSSTPSPSQPTNPPRPRPRLLPVIIVGSVMFSFISYWRTAAVVLCDMSSTMYYIGAIVETAVGTAAPWFILAVLVFSFALTSVYIESSALFVRGGVYRVVKEALGGFLAKVSVSALMFDYILTGPISGVSAGQYLVGLILDAFSYAGFSIDDASRQAIKNGGAVLIACAITLYFFRQNLLGISESSDKALKIMMATTVMGVVLLGWCGATLAIKGPVNPLPSWHPDLRLKTELDAAGQPVPRINSLTGAQEDPLGFIAHVPSVAEPLREPANWLTVIGALGLLIAFGHSILAMSGLETLAQVYREVESPKLPNFKKAAFIVFLYSLLLTGTTNFLAVLLIPDQQRMGQYYDNWIAGLTMNLIGPLELRLLLTAFVVVIGFLILSGAVNTSIIGSNGVLSRVAEDGVLPDWFLKPHRRYGTSSRILYLITGLQLLTIFASQGNVILLGEAYAFGVVWSFVFNSMSMVVLRFKDRRPREFKVPFNIRLGSVEVPVGLGLIFLLVFVSAIANLLTKEVATLSGAAFTLAFLAVFVATERYHERKRRGAKHEHRDQFNREVAQEVTAESLKLTRQYRKLVAIRSPQNLFMLQQALAETDPDTTDVVVMTAKVTPQGGGEAGAGPLEMDTYDQQLMTAVVQRAESAGKTVTPLIVPTNNPVHAVLKTAKDIRAHELVVGASNKFTADEQLDQFAFYWINLCGGQPEPLTVHLLGRDRDVHFDLGGGNRIPKISERQARSVAELRAAGVGVDRVLLLHDNTALCSDLFQAVMTMLDPQVILEVFPIAPAVDAEHSALQQDAERAQKLGRELTLHEAKGGALLDEVLQAVKDDRIDLIILSLHQPQDRPALNVDELTRRATCRIFLAPPLSLPQEPEDQPAA